MPRNFHEKNIEKEIQDELISLDDGLSNTINPASMYGYPVFYTFYDRKNKGCIMVDCHKLTDFYDEKLYDYVIKRPKRFILVTNDMFKLEDDIRRKFARKIANKENIPELLLTLDDDSRMKFYEQIKFHSLEDKWTAYRLDYYDKNFKKLSKCN